MTEQQLRRALGAANELEPPQDDLFVERALSRGRARAGHRRRIVMGAAAGVALVSVVGGMWLGIHSGGVSAESTSLAPSAEAGAGSLDSTAGGSPALRAPSLPVLTGGPRWITGRATPERTALEQVLPMLELSYPDTFGGAYATDSTNTRFVLTVTRPDPALEALVRGRLSEPGEVSFALVTHTAASKEEVARQVLGDAQEWRAQGVTIVGTRIDARADRVVVTVREPGAVSRVEARYGPDIVLATVGVGQPAAGAVTETPPSPAP